MSDVVRAELFKLVRRPAAWVLLAAAAVLNQIFSYLIPYLSYRSGDPSALRGGSTPEQLLASTLPGPAGRQHHRRRSRCSPARWPWCSVR